MGRSANTVTGATEAGKAMAAPAAGRKGSWESTGGDEISYKKLESVQDEKAMLCAKCGGSNGSPATSTASTKASSSVSASPLSILQSPLATPVFDNEIPNVPGDVNWQLDQKYDTLKKMNEQFDILKGSSEAAYGDEVIGFPNAPPTVLPSPEAVESTPLSVPHAVLPTFDEQVRKTEVGLLEPEPKKVVESIDTATDDDEEMRRWAKLADEGFDLRCGPGQRFARAPEGKSEAYKSLNNAQKAEFRKQWAKNIYTSIRKVKVKSEAWSKIDVSKGTYMPFACIVREEGNDDAGMTAAVHYVQACQVMAGVWKKWNLMTKRWEFLYMRQEVQEIFEQSWKVFEEHQQGTGHQEPGALAPGKGTSAVTGSPEAAVKAVGKGTVTGATEPAAKKNKGAVTGATELAAKKGKGSHLKPKTPDSKKTPFEVSLQDALATREIYMTVLSKCALVTEQLSTNKAWEWARGYFQDEMMKIDGPLKELSNKGFARIS